MSSALVLGATGLIGGELLDCLENDPAYESIVAFVRRPRIPTHGKVNEVVVDHDNPDSYRSHLAVDDVFCCLGTTVEKAGSESMFRHVDLEIPLTVAKESLAAGATRFLIVTAVSADTASSRLYSRVKGELENELRALPFPGGIKIFRPGLLLGKREERRIGEEVAAVVMRVIKPLLVGKRERYRAIAGHDVAVAMVNTAKLQEPSIEIYEGAELFERARA